MGSESTKKIVVGPRDDQSPDIMGWQINPPGSGTRDPLSLDFNESLDWMLAGITMKVLTGNKDQIAGYWSLYGGESQMRFYPAEPWNTGNYMIEVEGRLEDLAGNNLNRLFEKDLHKPNPRTQEKLLHTRTFSILKKLTQ